MRGAPHPFTINFSRLVFKCCAIKKITLRTEAGFRLMRLEHNRPVCTKRVFVFVSCCRVCFDMDRSLLVIQRLLLSFSLSLSVLFFFLSFLFSIFLHMKTHNCCPLCWQIDGHLQHFICKAEPIISLCDLIWR